MKFPPSDLLFNEESRETCQESKNCRGRLKHHQIPRAVGP